MIVSAVLSHILESITPASEVQRAHARARARLGGDLLAELAGALAAAQHSAPRAGRRALVVALGDHGAGDPGVSLGAEHPTAAAARELAHGRAALGALARAGRAELVLLDCGLAEPSHAPSLVRLGRRPSGDARAEAALTVVEAQAALEAGVAVTVALVDSGVEVLGVGALGLGAEVACAALAGALLPQVASPRGRPDEPELVALGRARRSASAFELLCAFAGPEQAVLVGLLLAAASMNVPVILDGESTLVAALLAARLAPACTGYFIASQRGSGYGPDILDTLGLAAILAGGAGSGEGAGAAMILAFLDQLQA